MSRFALPPHGGVNFRFGVDMSKRGRGRGAAAGRGRGRGAPAAARGGRTGSAELRSADKVAIEPHAASARYGAGDAGSKWDADDSVLGFGASTPASPANSASSSSPAMGGSGGNQASGIGGSGGAGADASLDALDAFLDDIDSLDIGEEEPQEQEQQSQPQKRLSLPNAAAQQPVRPKAAQQSQSHYGTLPRPQQPAAAASPIALAPPPSEAGGTYGKLPTAPNRAAARRGPMVLAPGKMFH